MANKAWTKKPPSDYRLKSFIQSLKSDPSELTREQKVVEERILSGLHALAGLVREEAMKGGPASLHLNLAMCRDQAVGGVDHPSRYQAVPVPLWLVDALGRALEKQMEKGRSSRGGRSSAPSRQRSYDMLHLLRYSAVMNCRDEGMTWLKAYDQASDRLGDAFGKSSPEACADSYKLVRREFERDPSRFVRVMHETMLLMRQSVEYSD